MKCSVHPKTGRVSFGLSIDHELAQSVLGIMPMIDGSITEGFDQIDKDVITMLIRYGVRAYEAYQQRGYDRIPIKDAIAKALLLEMAREHEPSGVAAAKADCGPAPPRQPGGEPGTGGTPEPDLPIRNRKARRRLEKRMS